MQIASHLSSTPTEQTQLENIIKPQNMIKHSAPDNAVSDHSPAPQGGQGSPTDGAREATPPKPPGYAEIEQMTEDRLNSNPEYRELKEKLELWKDLETDFALIDRHTSFLFGTGDGTVVLQDLRALVDDPLFPNPEAKAAAQRLLNNMSIWNELARGDNRVGTHDVSDFLAGIRNQMKAMKEEARAAITAENAPPPSGGSVAGSPQAAAGAAPGTPGASEPSAEQSAGPSQLFKAPAHSSKPGMEGAVENVGNTLTAIGDATSALMAQLSDPNLKPEDRQKLQAAFNELQQLQSMLTAMYKQLQEAIANLMKMYSDVAMNSVRNMK